MRNSTFSIALLINLYINKNLTNKLMQTMKNVMKVAMPLALALMVSACGNKEEQHADNHDAMEHNESMMDNKETMGATAGPVILKDDKLNAVYQHYMHLTTALTRADMAEAKVAANAIEAGAKDVSGGGTLASAASKISSASSVEDQRAAYETMSNDMMRLVKKAGLAEGKVYVQYCPMAFDNKGASWLSSTEEIRNPYMGEKMMSCGENRESIQ